MLNNLDAIVGVFGSIITIIIFVDKIGVRKILKDLMMSKKYQEEAFLALLKYHLEDVYQRNRLYKAWTVDECAIQTALHDAYVGLGGNGEAAIWWKNQQKWAIVSDEEMDTLVGKCAFKIDQEAKIKAYRESFNKGYQANNQQSNK